MTAHRLVASALLVGGCGFDLTAVATPPVDAAPDVAIDAAPPACLGALCRRLTLTIDHTKVSGGPHLAFPVLVDVTSTGFEADAAPTGFDLRFTAADGTTELPYERSLFASGRLVAWVAVPSVSSTTDTVLYLYYGDRSATVDRAMPSAVWTDAYQGVWHLEESSGGSRAILDSTVRGHHGTNEGGLTLAAAGKVGRAILHDGVDDRLRVATTPELEQATATATISLWVNYLAVQNATYQRVLMSEHAIIGDTTGFEWGSQPVGLQDAHYYYPSNAGSSNYRAIALPFVSGQWHHLAVTQDFAAKTVALYVDGTLRVALSDNTPTLWTNRASAGDWFWGGMPPRTGFAGRLDELRIATTVRSAEWIATEYENQNAPQTFVLAGPTIGP